MSDDRPPRFEPLEVTLPGGRRLIVRELGPHDVAAVSALYEALNDEDRRLRFFSAFRPTDAFIERWLQTDGGLVLGAFVGEAGSGELVGEAGYALLPNGNGELGITTAAGWRGWLGPFLLDVLAEAAARAGVANIEADIRLDNGPMLGLIRRRGAALAEQPAWSQVRLVMGTGASTPGWPPAEDPARLRVLVEAPAGRWSPGLTDAERQRLEVISCAGPHGRRNGRCPVLDGGRCPLVDGADAVVVVTGGDNDGSFEALAAAHRHGDPTLAVHTCSLSGAVGELLRRLDRTPSEPPSS